MDNRQQGPEVVPGWRLSYEEISNGVYRIRLQNQTGQLVETTSLDWETGVGWCVQAALDIDQQLKTKNAPLAH